MIRLFKSESPIVLAIFTVLVVLYGAITWVIPIVPSEETNLTNVYVFIQSSKWFNQVLMVLFTLLTGVLLNMLCNSFKMLKRSSYLIGLSYILIQLTFPNNFIFKPWVVLNFLLVFILKQLFELSATTNVKTNCFNASFLIGLLTLQNVEYSLLMLPFIVALGYFKTFNLKEWLVSLVGLILPYSYILFFEFFFNQSLIQRSWSLPTSFSANVLSFGDLLGMGLLCIVLLFATGITLRYYSQNVALVRRRLSLFFILLLLAPVLWFFGSEVSITNLFALAAMPMAIFIGWFFAELKREFVANLVFLGWLAIIGFNVYSKLF